MSWACKARAQLGAALVACMVAAGARVIHASGPSPEAAAPPAPAQPAEAAVCAGCHGPTGNSAVALWPRLAGQRAEYLAKQMENFRSGARADPMMAGVAAGISEDAARALGAWYASQPVARDPVDKSKAEKGSILYLRGDPARRIAACASCHGTRGEGVDGFLPGGVPALAGQHAPYTVKQIEAYRRGERTSDPNGMMRYAASKLDASDVAAVAEFLAGIE